MKRLRRFSFKALSLLSLLVFAVTVVLWIRSHTVADTQYVVYRPKCLSLGLYCSNGEMTVHLMRRYAVPEPGFTFGAKHYESTPSPASADTPKLFSPPATCYQVGKFSFVSSSDGTAPTRAQQEQDIAQFDAIARQYVLLRKELEASTQPSQQDERAMLMLDVRLTQLMGVGRGKWQCRLCFPAWFACAFMLILPSARGYRIYVRTRERQRVGLCRVCNYDLRATPDLCPECGTVPDQNRPFSN